MIAINRALVAMLLCIMLLAQAHAQSQPSKTAGGPYIVVIHCGPNKANDPAIKKLTLSLTGQGYSVREPEEDQDKVGGPGVDYFSPDAKGEADKMADLVSTELSLKAKPPSRLQSVNNALYQKFYLGVWLY